MEHIPCELHRTGQLIAMIVDDDLPPRLLYQEMLQALGKIVNDVDSLVVGATHTQASTLVQTVLDVHSKV